MRDGFYALSDRGKAAHERIFGARGSDAAAQRDGSPGTSPAASLPPEPFRFDWRQDPSHPAHDPS